MRASFDRHKEKKKEDEMNSPLVHIAIYHYSTDQCIWLIE